jgi:hypothetical protein
MKNCICVLLLALLLPCVGCHNWETRTYDVTVKNAGPDPVTVWLTKDGEPFEPGWYSPENLILHSPKEPPKEISGVIIPPDKVASTGPRTGRFDPHTHAILRIYAGQLGMNQMLATSAGPGREDLRLAPGQNVITVKSSAGSVTVLSDQPSD